MTYSEYIAIKRGSKIISEEVGILSHIMKLPHLNADPNVIAYGVWPGDTKVLGGAKYNGRSSGCGYTWKDAILGTIGETVERYCCAFYKKEEFVKSSYNKLERNAIHPKEFALYHEEQYTNINFPYAPFTEDIEISWVPCIDLTNGEEVLYPGSLIYLPWVEDEDWISLSISTGLAAHTNLHSAILTALYEIIERDSFVITWMQELNVPKLKITEDISEFINANRLGNYEFHFLDVTYDLSVPTIFAICFGEADYGPFVAVASATRSTYAEAVRKVIQEVGQTIPYFRYVLGEKKDWIPSGFEHLSDFEDHSVFYIKSPEHLHVFDKWRNKAANKVIDFREKNSRSEIEEVKHILQIFKDASYNVIFKDLTTPDVKQAGFYSVRLAVPQTIEMSGTYAQYFSGGKRLYDTPKLMGYPSKSYTDLNQYPYPFP